MVWCNVGGAMRTSGSSLGRAAVSLFLAGFCGALMVAASSFANVVLPPPLPPGPSSGSYQAFPANDLGMHCADPDFQIFTVLPPFNVLHAQVIQKGNEPLTVPKILNGSG